MAENYVKEHLDEYLHRFKDEHYDRLVVSGWDKTTPADGNWININTIKPLSARDVYLAECLDEISANQRVYKAGDKIIIDPIPSTNPTQYTISVVPEYRPTNYTFVSGINVETDEENNKHVYVNIKTDTTGPTKNFLKFDENNALYCDASEIEYYTMSIHQESYERKETVNTYNYNYNLAKQEYEILKELPPVMEPGKIYLLG